ncbi:MAG: hypothetical protein SNJ69_11240 [Chloroflexaceae bacterium]
MQTLQQPAPPLANRTLSAGGDDQRGVRCQSDARHPADASIEHTLLDQRVEGGVAGEDAAPRHY